MLDFDGTLIALFVFAGCRGGQNCKSNDESEKGDLNARCRPSESDSKESNKSSFPGNKKDKSDSDDCCCPDKVGLGGKKPCCSSSKINDSSGGGVLRYALHLRFLCPSSKKSSKSMLRCKSDPSSAPYSTTTVAEEERRFYLYNDLRVVFPQRHSDSDEGQVCKLMLLKLSKPLALSISPFYHHSGSAIDLHYSFVAQNAHMQ